MSDITYEELILSVAVLVRLFVISFCIMSDITYEELIRYKALHGKHICRRYLLKSDITYEELIPNHGQCWTHHVLNLLSDITYEELIQSSTVYSEVNEASSDITYEELIHSFCFVMVCKDQSDITYEELIHFRQQQSHLPETLKKSRRTLPMRN